MAKLSDFEKILILTLIRRSGKTEMANEIIKWILEI